MTTEQNLPPMPPNDPLPPPAPQPYSPPSAAPSAGTPTNTLAIIALVSGLLGWTLLPWLGSIAAVITGHMARAEIRRTPGQDGDGLAIAGLVLGWSMIALSVLTVLAVILFFGGLAVLLGALGLSGQL